jgi:hypothetical protein
VQRIVIDDTPLGRRKTLVACEVGTAHRAQVIREGEAADDALRRYEPLARRPHELRVIRSTQHRRLDEVARHGDLEPAAKAGAVDRGNDWDG